MWGRVIGQIRIEILDVIFKSCEEVQRIRSVGLVQSQKNDGSQVLENFYFQSLFIPKFESIRNLESFDALTSIERKNKNSSITGPFSHLRPKATQQKNLLYNAFSQTSCEMPIKPPRHWKQIQCSSPSSQCLILPVLPCF